MAFALDGRVLVPLTPKSQPHYSVFSNQVRRQVTYSTLTPSRVRYTLIRRMGSMAAPGRMMTGGLLSSWTARLAFHSGGESVGHLDDLEFGALLDGLGVEYE